MVPPAWTLVIEVSFYIAMPILLLPARRPLQRFGRTTRIALAGDRAGGERRRDDVAAPHLARPRRRMPHPDLRPFSFSLPIWWDAFALGMLSALAVTAGRGTVPFGRELRYAAIVPMLGAWDYFGDPGVDRNTLFAIACAMAVTGIAGAPAGAFTAPARDDVAEADRLVVVRHVPVAPADPVRPRADAACCTTTTRRAPCSGCPCS